MAGYHFSEPEHIALSLPFYVPTGSYDPTRLANAGQNTWTFSPTVAYTRLLAGGGEFTAVTAIDFYTRNDDTDYKNGAVFRIDDVDRDHRPAMAPGRGRRLDRADPGRLRDRPPTSSTASRATPSVSARSTGPARSATSRRPSRARWVYDVDAKNRPKGNGVSLSLTLPFL